MSLDEEDEKEVFDENVEYFGIKKLIIHSNSISSEVDTRGSHSSTNLTEDLDDLLKLTRRKTSILGILHKNSITLD